MTKQVHQIQKTIILAAVTVLAVSWLAGCAQQTDEAVVRFAIISDRTGGHEPGIHEKIAAEVERLRPDFVMTVGDMIEGYVDDADRIHDEWDEYDSVVSVLSTPLYLTPGNHDIWSDLSDSIYRERVGEPYYSFDDRNLHFVVLDASRSDGSNDMPEEQLTWLIDDLKSHQQAAYTLVFLHKPFWYDAIEQNKADTLHAIFKQHGVDAVFTGHYHEYFCGEYDGITYTGLGSSGGGMDLAGIGPRYHYAWVTVDTEGVHIAPINMGSVLPWNVVTADDKMRVDRIRHFGLAFDHPAGVTDQLKVPLGTLKVMVRNVYSDHEVADTIRWDVPEGWSVEPTSLPVKVPPGQKQSYPFTVECRGDLYPAPQVSVGFVITEDKRLTVTNRLQVARAAPCIHTVSAPVIDGKISEPCWQQPVTQLFGPNGKPRDIDPVAFYFAYDDQNLYLAARCQDSHIDSLVADVTEHDGAVYFEDCVGYFVEPIFGSDTAYQIYFNALGTSFDQQVTKGADGWMDYNREWNGTYETRTVRGEDYWSIETCIPTAQFGATIDKGKEWRINFRRKQRRFESAADFQSPIDYNPDTYGYLVMR